MVKVNILLLFIFLVGSQAHALSYPRCLSPMRDIFVSVGPELNKTEIRNCFADHLKQNDIKGKLVFVEAETKSSLNYLDMGLISASFLGVKQEPGSKFVLELVSTGLMEDVAAENQGKAGHAKFPSLEEGIDFKELARLTSSVVEKIDEDEKQQPQAQPLKVKSISFLKQETTHVGLKDNINKLLEKKFGFEALSRSEKIKEQAFHLVDITCPQ